MDFHYIPETCDVQLLKPINHSAQFLQKKVTKIVNRWQHLVKKERGGGA